MTTTLTRDEITTLRLKRNELVSRARVGGVQLRIVDFYLSGGMLVIDGMDAEEWVVAMCETE